MADEKTGLVPEEAIKAAADGIRMRDLTAPRPGPLAALAYGRAALEAAAPLILAAELIRLADEIGSSATLAHEGAGENDTAALTSVANLSIAARLRERASVLRGEGHRND